MESTAVVDYLKRMGLRAGEYDPLTHEFAADRVDRDEAHELRIRYAERPRADVARLAS